MSTPFPDIRQDHAGGCGVACIKACYLFAGKEVPAGVDELSDPENGFHGGVEGMISALGHLGNVRRSSNLSHFPLVSLIIDEDDFEHWIVVLHVSQWSVWFHCPQDGLRILPIDTFMKFWGDARLSERYLGLRWGAS